VEREVEVWAWIFRFHAFSWCWLLRVSSVSIEYLFIIDHLPTNTWYLGSADALKCYECKSKEHQTCSDPFNTTEAAHFLIECPPAPAHVLVHTNDSSAKFCRKLKQTSKFSSNQKWISANWFDNFSVDGQTLVTSRSCGYLENHEQPKDGKSCFKDAFSSFSSSIYCDCKVDGCNHSGPEQHLSKILCLFLAISIALQLVYWILKFSSRSWYS
jgi:Sleepless protein